MKLNLCCGRKPMAGYTNVDFQDTKYADVVHDLNETLPFEDGAADEIICIHGFEHFFRYQSDEILIDWVRVLKPGGVLILELPCLDKIISLINHTIRTGQELPENLTLWGLYGDPKYRDPAMVHKWCYSMSELTAMMELNGLSVRSEKPQTHQPLRDMRLEGRK